MTVTGSYYPSAPELPPPAGGEFIIRRFCRADPPDRLGHAEACELAAAGKQITAVWDGGPGRAGGGAAAGRADAREAMAQARAAGMPEGRPVYFRVDAVPGPWPAVAAASYLDGAAQVLGRGAVGIAAGYHLIQAVLARGAAVWAWQDAPGPGGDREPHAVLHGTGQGSPGDGDLVEAAAADYGQWQPPGTWPPAPASSPRRRKPARAARSDDTPAPAAGTGQDQGPAGEPGSQQHGGEQAEQ